MAGQDNKIWISWLVDSFVSYNGYTYMVGLHGISSKTGEQASAIFRVSESGDHLEIVWENEWDVFPAVPEGTSNNYLNTFSVDKLSGEFYAQGAYQIVRGNLNDLSSIKAEIVPPDCFGCCQCLTWETTWVDWKTRTIYGAGGPKPRDEKRFRKRLLDGGDWVELEPKTLETNLNYWASGTMAGTSVEDLYLTSTYGIYKYHPEKESWDYAFNPPVEYGSWTDIYHSYYRALSVIHDDKGNYRALATGVDLPVMIRMGCHEWQELYPNSIGARTIFDAGDSVFVAGVGNTITQWTHEKGVKVFQGPKDGWKVAQSIVRTDTGEVLVLSWHDDQGMDTRLYYNSGAVTPYKSAFVDQWIQVPTPDCTLPPYCTFENLFIIKGRPYLLMLQSGKSRLYPVQTEHNTPLLGQAIEFSGRIFPHEHDGKWYFTGGEGVSLFDPETNQLSTIIPKIADYRVVTDAVPLSNQKWALLTTYEPFIIYDMDTSTYTSYYLPAMNITDDTSSDPSSPWRSKLTPLWEPNSLPLRLEKLPSGEILIASGQGNIISRISDEEWNRGIPETDGDLD